MLIFRTVQFSLRQNKVVRLFSTFQGPKHSFHYKIAIPKLVRNLSLCVVQQARAFIDSENRYAHDVLANSTRTYQFFNPIMTERRYAVEKLPDSILKPPEVATVDLDGVVEDFKALMLTCRDNNVRISEDRFDSFVDLFCDVCHKFSDKQLIECLSHLREHPPTDSTRTKNFAEIWTALDTACLERIQHWDSDQLLHLCDAWYQLGLGRVSQFVWNSLRKIGRRVRKMSIEEMLHSMFLCNIVRKPGVVMFEYEAPFLRLIDEMSIDEIGVMSLGFFKTQTLIRSPELLEKIFNRLIQTSDTVKDITLVSILKILRYSSKLGHTDLIVKLLDNLVPQIERISLLSCVHVGLLGTDIQLSHEQVLELILKRFISNIEVARLKDLERVSHVVSLNNYKSPEGLEKVFCQNVIKSLRNRVEEIMRYPRSFMSALHFLSMCGVYDEEILSAALDPKFVLHTYNGNIVKANELFCLDSFARINLQGSYSGSLLSDKNRRTMGKLMTDYIPQRNSGFSLSATDRILLEVKETVDCLLRKSTIKHILPHFSRADIIVCYDSAEKKAIPISPDCAQDYIGAILTRTELLGAGADNRNFITVAIVIGGWNNVVRNRNRPTGALQMKLDQLNILGHKPVVVYWDEWRNLETQRDRLDFIRRRLAAACV